MDIEEFNSMVGDLSDQYEDLYNATSTEIPVDNIKLKEALANQVNLELRWDPILSNARKLRSHAHSEQESAFSEAINGLLTNSYRKYSISEARELAKAEKTYRQWREAYIEIDDLFQDIKNVIDVIHSRRYVMNNMTNSLISSVSESLL